MARHVRIQPAGAGQLSYDVTSEAAMTGEDLSKLNPGTLCVTLDTGATYEAYPTGTTPPVGATTIAAVNGVWLYVSTAGTRPTSSVIFRPGVASAGPAVATWAEVQAAIAAADGLITVAVDGSHAPALVPGASGVTDCQGATTFMAYNQVAGAVVDDTLTIKDGATLHRPKQFSDGLYLAFECFTTAALTFATAAGSAQDVLQVQRFVNLILLAGATVAPIQVAAGGTFYLATARSVNLDTSAAGAVPFISLGVGANLLWDCYEGGACIGTNTVSGGGVTATITYNFDSLSVPPPFAAFGFTGRVVNGRLPFFTWAAPTNPKIQFLGDSNTAGLAQGIYRDTTASKLRQWRSDFEIIGSISAPPTAPPNGCAGAIQPQSWYHDGHSGFTIAQLAAGYASFVAAPTGAPDVVVVMAGTNDLPSRTLLQMQTDWAALYAAIVLANPSAIVVAMPPPNVVAGSVSGGNVATWQALRNLFRNWLMTTWVPANPGTSFCDASSAPGIDDFYTDGIHWNEQGASNVGETLADVLNTLMGKQTTPIANGDSLPRTFLPRTAQGSAPLWKNTSGLSVAAHAGLNPGAGSFTFAIDYMPQSTSAPALQTIAVYGTIAGGGGANWWALFQFGSELRLYWFSAGEVIAASVPNILLGTNVLTSGAWHRIIVMADASTNTVGLYLNGSCIGLATGVTAWNTAQETFFLGYEATNNNGAPGTYARAMAWKAVPARPGGEQALIAAERDYYLGDSIVAGSCSCNFQLDQSLTDQDFSNPPLVAVTYGGGLLVAYPGASPLRPWEVVGAQPPAFPTWISGRIVDIDFSQGDGRITITGASLIVAVADASGAGNNANEVANPPTLAYAGIGGRPCYLGDGASTFLDMGALSVAQPCTIYVVAQCAVQATKMLLGATAGGWFMGCGDATHMGFFYGATVYVTFDGTKPAIYRAVVNNLSSSFRASPGNVSVGPVACGSAAALIPFHIGDYDMASWWWDKWIGRVVIFNRLLTTFEDAAVMAALGGQWSIAVP